MANYCRAVTKSLRGTLLSFKFKDDFWHFVVYNILTFFSFLRTKNIRAGQSGPGSETVLFFLADLRTGTPRNLHTYDLRINHKFADLRFADLAHLRYLRICNYAMSPRICGFAICHFTSYNVTFSDLYVNFFVVKLTTKWNSIQRDWVTRYIIINTCRKVPLQEIFFMTTFCFGVFIFK
jgi:hypothetical protein